MDYFALGLNSVICRSNQPRSFFHTVVSGDIAVR